MNQKLKLAEDRADATESKFLETLSAVKHMEETHALELQEARASGAAAGSSAASEALKDAQDKAKEFSERAATAEQHILRLQDDFEVESGKAREAAKALAEEQKKSALILEKFNRLGEVSKKLKEQATTLTGEKEQLEHQLTTAKSAEEETKKVRAALAELKTKMDAVSTEGLEWKKKCEEGEVLKQRLTSGTMRSSCRLAVLTIMCVDLATLKAKVESHAESAAKKGEQDSALNQRVLALEKELSDSRDALDKEKTRSNGIEDKVNRLIPKLSEERKKLMEQVAVLEKEQSASKDKLKQAETRQKTDAVKIQEVQQSLDSTQFCLTLLETLLMLSQMPLALRRMCNPSSRRRYGVYKSCSWQQYRCSLHQPRHALNLPFLLAHRRQRLPVERLLACSRNLQKRRIAFARLNPASVH